ncbi:MAG: STAS domain-containing protein [Oscillatoriophycideae cyanobacterium NC_groundwater_1537_Pr4_S-0.65um_50_18]|nr:STAS domain-containing protein [Oscillatoriophycideae cyanobacterium NC_groundwater_1537_Pr4_S-0.65um_50_18]
MNNLPVKPSHPIFQPTRILSVSSSASLLDWVNQRLESGDRILLIDFCHVMFMDSTGLGALVTALKVAQKAEGKLVLCSLWGQARMLFNMAGMESVFEIYDGPEDFENSLSSLNSVGSGN